MVSRTRVYIAILSRVCSCRWRRQSASYNRHFKVMNIEHTHQWTMPMYTTNLGWEAPCSSCTQLELALLPGRTCCSSSGCCRRETWNNTSTTGLLIATAMTLERACMPPETLTFVWLAIASYVYRSSLLCVHLSLACACTCTDVHATCCQVCTRLRMHLQHTLFTHARHPAISCSACSADCVYSCHFIHKREYVIIQLIVHYFKVLA